MIVEGFQPTVYRVLSLFDAQKMRCILYLNGKQVRANKPIGYAISGEYRNNLVKEINVLNKTTLEIEILDL